MYVPTWSFNLIFISVSVGGTTGLFVGASILSFVEFIFYFTIRFANNILMGRRKRNPKGVIKLKRLEPVTNIIRADNIAALENIQQGPYENSGVRVLRL